MSSHNLVIGRFVLGGVEAVIRKEKTERWKASRPRGEAHRKCKLLDCEVDIIRFMREIAGMSCQRLSDDFSVSRKHVWRLCNKRSRNAFIL